MPLFGGKKEGTSAEMERETQKDVAVGLPKPGVGTANYQYTDTNIETHDVRAPVTDIHSGVEKGTDVGMKEEVVSVPVTTMEKTTVQVPETVMEKFTVTKPVTHTKEVPETVRDVETRMETVEREEVVIDKEMVEQPTTVMKPVTVEEPRIVETTKTVTGLTEELQKVTVVRPRVAEERVKVMRPVEVKKMVLVKRPVLVPRKVPVKAPVQTVDLINVTQPELSSYQLDVEVPVEEAKHVNYEQPVTVLKGGDGLLQTDKSAADYTKSRDLDKSYSTKRDLNEIPVGLPFTEMVERAKNFNVTELRKETQSVRQTVMQPVQFEKHAYEMADAEVEIIEVDWEEVEQEIIVSELQEFEDTVKVTILDEVEEEWPVARERKHEVLTSAVTLEPRTAQVPEIGSEAIEVEKPRTVTKTEQIEKTVPVEREVMVEKAFTEYVEVPAERPVEKMRDVEVEQPVVHYEQTTVQTPITTEKEVSTQEARDREETFKDQVASSQARDVNYKVAKPSVAATAVPGEVAVEGNAPMVGVTDKELAAAKERNLRGAPGVEGYADVHDGHASGYKDDAALGYAARDVAPDAVIDGGITGADSRREQYGTDGHLESSSRGMGAAGAGAGAGAAGMGAAGPPGAGSTQVARGGSVTSSASSSDVEGGTSNAVDGTSGTTGTTGTASGKSGKKEKKGGLIGKMKAKMHM